MENFDQQWEKVLDFFKHKFTDGETPELDTILFLIGIQELGMIKPKFTKDEKVNLMHVATCKLLEPYGYYELSHRDEEGWPHFKRIKSIEPGINQDRLIKEAIINYFNDNQLI
ncbi:MAG TPA: hypothetical protein ENK64_02345 [Flavobacteriales bacterium]|jgi:hypothetical protein|nr:hypothetical protein [Flavobacteriales bacterium]